MIRILILPSIILFSAFAAPCQSAGQITEAQKAQMAQLKAERGRLHQVLDTMMKRTAYLRDRCDSLFKKMEAAKAGTHDSLQAAKKAKPFEEKLDFYLTKLDQQVGRQNKCNDSLQLVLDKIDSLRKDFHWQ